MREIEREKKNIWERDIKENESMASTVYERVRTNEVNTTTQRMRGEPRGEVRCIMKQCTSTTTHNIRVKDEGIGAGEGGSCGEARQHRQPMQLTNVQHQNIKENY